MRKYTEAQRAKKRAERQALTAKVREAVKAGVIPTGYVSARGHVYSPWNASMLALQGAPAGVYATFKQWQESGRMVMKGQHGFAIAFVSRDEDAGYVETRKNADGKETSTVRATFRTYTVFEEGQTEIIDASLAFQNVPPVSVTSTGALAVGQTTEVIPCPF